MICFVGVIVGLLHFNKFNEKDQIASIFTNRNQIETKKIREPKE